MTSLGTSPRLAGVLAWKRPEIFKAWSDRIQQQAGQRYAMLPVDELETQLGREYDALVEALSTGDSEAVRIQALELSRARLHQGFRIGEVLEGLLLFREAALPVLLAELTRDPESTAAELGALDFALRLLIRQFSDAYSGAAHRSMARLTLLEERHRLARELHDSVSQSLYGVSMYSEAAARQLEAGNADRTVSHLHEVREHALEAL